MNKRVFLITLTALALLLHLSGTRATAATLNSSSLTWSVQYLIDQSQTVLGQNQFSAPRDNRGLAISPDGRYLYAGYNNGPEVRKIDLTQTDYTAATIARTTVSRGKAITVDDQGRVYLADGSAIKILDANLGSIQYTITMTKCEGVAVKRENGILALYATERGGQNTLTRWVLTESGGGITSATRDGLDGDGVIAIVGASDMRGVAVDSSGRIWIADPSATTGNGKVFRLNSDGAGLVSNTAVPNPYAMAFNGDEVLVTGGYQRVISILDINNLTITGTIIPPFSDLELDPDGNSSAGSLTGIVVTSDGFYVTNEAGQTADGKSTYGVDDTASGYIDGKYYTDVSHDDNDPILKAKIPNQPPVAEANGPYLVAAGQSIALDHTGSYDPDNDQLNYAWAVSGEPLGTTTGETFIAGNQAGITEVTLTVDDGKGGTATDQAMVVVYDPSGGFVTGGGWIDSPINKAYQYMQVGGKATFGFVAKYKKGANVPDGNTEFQFKTGDLNFKSTSYEWLVVAGNKAQFKGEGTINGQGSYKFMIWADDDDPDTFRIQIWGNSGTVYDNGPNQALGGGSVVVHKK